MTGTPVAITDRVRRSWPASPKGGQHGGREADTWGLTVVLNRVGKGPLEGRAPAQMRNRRGPVQLAVGRANSRQGEEVGA